MFKSIIASVALSFIVSPALAQGWIHGSESLDAKEGGFVSAGEDGLYVHYYCSYDEATITVGADGMLASPGMGSISIDGETLFENGVTYLSETDITKIVFHMERDFSSAPIEKFNAFVSAVAGGSELVWTLPNGTTYEVDLTGSAGISACKM